MEITAEGVETADQLDKLRSSGVTAVQGYLLGRPMSPADARLLMHLGLGVTRGPNQFLQGTLDDAAGAFGYRDPRP